MNLRRNWYEESSNWKAITGNYAVSAILATFRGSPHGNLLMLIYRLISVRQQVLSFGGQNNNVALVWHALVLFYLLIIILPN